MALFNFSIQKGIDDILWGIIVKATVIAVHFSGNHPAIESFLYYSTEGENAECFSYMNLIEHWGNIAFKHQATKSNNF
ncbi:hypothetical protein [Eubacterium aggregans]|uniref:hypothetical protein n=1 Tax=Eubacterium aggregans TaxID=81409 RepID=UPI003F2BFFC1